MRLAHDIDDWMRKMTSLTKGGTAGAHDQRPEATFEGWNGLG